MLQRILEFHWSTTTLLLTAIQVGLGALSLLIAKQIENEIISIDDNANWDAISAGVTLLLATYLPVELTKHAEVKEAYYNVSQKLRQVLSRGASDALIRSVGDTVLSNDFKIEDARKSVTNLSNSLQASQNDNEITMDRLSELEDAVVRLKSKRDYSVPHMYQRVLLIVVTVYYGIILPGAKYQDGKYPYSPLLSVLFVGFINNLILATGLEAGGKFRNEKTDDFKEVQRMFVDIYNPSFTSTNIKSRYPYYIKSN